MSESIVRRRLIVSGHVQGVFYRDSVRECARNEGVAGWAANRGDGTVELVLEGPEAAVGAVVEYCRLGPVSARVETVQVSEEQPEGLSGFTVR